jgi:hypothetical protein
MKKIMYIAVCLSFIMSSCDKGGITSIEEPSVIYSSGNLLFEINDSELPNEKLFYDSNDNIVKIEKYSDSGLLKFYSKWQYDSKNRYIKREDFSRDGKKTFQKTYKYLNNIVEAIEFDVSGNNMTAVSKSIGELNKEGKIEKLKLFHKYNDQWLIHSNREYVWDKGNIVKVKTGNSEEYYTYDNNINPLQKYPLYCLHPDIPNTSVNNQLSHTYFNNNGDKRDSNFNYKYNKEKLPVNIQVQKTVINSTNTEKKNQIIDFIYH